MVSEKRAITVQNIFPMKFSVTILLALSGLVFFACQSNKPQVTTYNLTKEGFQYAMIVDKPGPVAQSGDMVFYHVHHRNGSLVTFSSRRASQSPNKMMLPDFTNGAVNPTALLDVMREMSAGDSATVRMDLTKLPMRPRGYESASYMNYDVAMIRIEKGKDQLVHSIQQQVKAMDSEAAAVQMDTDLGITNDRPTLSEEQKLEMWNKTVFANMQTVMRTVCREYKAGALDQNNRLQKTASGLKILEIQPGTGNAPSASANVSIKYIGTTIEGKEFDSRFEKDKYYSFPLGKDVLPKGVEEGIRSMKRGGKAVFIVPPNLAFGAKGREGVPPNTEVAYLVTLNEVQ